MTLDELLLEWSYKSEKGYPIIGNPSDISILKTILEKLDLPVDTIINRLSEGPLDAAELRKPRIGRTTGQGIRVQLFLDKINKGDEFELMDGLKIVIDKEQSQESVERLEQYLVDFKDDLTGMVFKDAEGKEYPLRSNGVFKKTAEFGSSGGSGGGTEETRYQESAHAYGCAIAYYVNKGPITNEDLNREKFEQASSYVNVDTSIDEIETFLEESPLWVESITKSVNQIYKLFPNNSFKIHRGSEQVQKIYNAWKQCKKEACLKMKDDKWNPADIWLMSSKVENHNWSNDIEILNGQISNFYEDNELIGISLKQISKKDNAKFEITNDPNISKDNTFKYKDYTTTPHSSVVDINYIDGNKGEEDKGGSIQLRNYSVEKSWCAEIQGKAARGGKACHGAVNDVLKLNGLEPLPQGKDILQAFKADDENHYDKLYYLHDRFIENISKEDFAKTYEKSELKWKTGNYMSLEFLSRIEDYKNMKTK